jgi:hypothetical protein
MLDELGKIVEEYLFNDLPYSMDDYLIEIVVFFFYIML